MVLPDKGITLDEGEEEQRLQERKEFAERVDGEAAKKRDMEVSKAWDEYTGLHLGEFKSSTLLSTTAWEAFKAGYAAGRKDENSWWEASDPGFVEEDFH